MDCKAVRTAMADFDVCEPTLDGARIATHCLYPSFEAVHVYVVKDGDNFIVHDGKGAFHAAWEHGRDERAIARAIDAEATRYQLSVDNHRLVASNVPLEWLRSAILAVANASSVAANVVVAKVVAAADEELVSKIDRVLSTRIAHSRIARNYKLRGASGGDRHFDFAIRGSEGYELFLNGVTSHHSSYSAKYVAFSDLEADRSSKIAVRDAPLKTDVEALLLKVATIVPLASLETSKVGAYTINRLETLN